jgi:hypothetical protein
MRSTTRTDGLEELPLLNAAEGSGENVPGSRSGGRRLSTEGPRQNYEMEAVCHKQAASDI